MNFQTMSRQRKFVLISSAIGFISMFLPWISFSMFGYTQTVNGMHNTGILVFICFVAAGIISFLGDQTKNLDKTMWTITLLAGATAFLFIIWFYSQATGTILGNSTIGFGIYISLLAAIGILGSAYIFRAPAGILKAGDQPKKEIKTTIIKPAETAENAPAATTPLVPPAAISDDNAAPPA